MESRVSLNILIYNIKQNRKQKICFNSKDSPDWFHFFPEWKQKQLNDHYAQKENSLQILSKHKGWITISLKTNDRNSPFEKSYFYKDKHEYIIPKWMNSNSFRNKNILKDEFKSVEYYPFTNKNAKMMILVNKNINKISNGNVSENRSIFNYQDFRNNVTFEKDRKYFDNLVKKEPRKFFFD